MNEEVVMKFGMRRPSWRGSLAARTSPARYLRHSLGWKAPRGWGWITNPRKALYNRLYQRRTFSPWRYYRWGVRRGRSRGRGCAVMLLACGVVWAAVLGAGGWAAWRLAGA